MFALKLNLFVLVLMSNSQKKETAFHWVRFHQWSFLSQLSSIGKLTCVLLVMVPFSAADVCRASVTVLICSAAIPRIAELNSAFSCKLQCLFIKSRKTRTNPHSRESWIIVSLEWLWCFNSLYHIQFSIFNPYAKASKQECISLDNHSMPMLCTSVQGSVMSACLIWRHLAMAWGLLCLGN